MNDVLLPHSPFHNLVLFVSDDEKRNIVLDVTKDFVLTRNQLQKVEKIFEQCLEIGLMKNPPTKPIFYMANTFVTKLPNGSEEGDYLAIDIGSTNLRVILAHLEPSKKPQYIIKHYDVPLEKRQGKAEKFFDYLAQCTASFMLEQSEEICRKRLKLGLTFSFGFEQLAINKSKIVEFAIQTNLPDAIGKCAVQFLQEALARFKLNVDVVAITNDTTATMVAGSGAEHDTVMGLILGSGFNICYLEDVDRIEKIDVKTTFPSGTKEVIINSECCLLGDDGAIDFAKTSYDREIDDESMNPRKVTLEKVFGGCFYGDLIRRVLRDIAKKEALFSGKVTPELLTKNSISAKDISEIENNNESAIRQLITRLGYNWKEMSNDDINILKYVSSRVCLRNALLLSVLLANLLKRINKPTASIAADGSVIEKHPKFYQWLTDFTEEFNPHNCFKIFLCKDGSGIGAALTAAMVEKYI